MRLFLLSLFLVAFSVVSFASGSCEYAVCVNITGFIDCPNTAGIRVTNLDTGQSLSGAYVDIQGPDSTQDITGDSGELTYNGIPEGTYTVSVACKASSSTNQCSPSTDQCVYAINQPTYAAECGYAKQDLIYDECSKDIVFDTKLDCNNNVKATVKSSDDHPMRNVVVNLYDSSNKLINSATTDLNGEAFVGPADDKNSFYVEIDPPSSYPIKKELKKFSYGPECLLNIEANPSCDRSITVTVTNDKTKEPVIGADIALTGPNGPASSKKTDGSGKVLYENVVAGSYKIDAFYSDIGQKSISQQIDFSYCPAYSSLAVDYQCKKLLVQFKNANNNPIAGGIVTVYSDSSLTNQLWYASTDNSGIARIDIEKGSYAIVAKDESGNYATTSFTADKDNCGDIKLDHILVCPDLLLVKISDANGKKLKGASVSLVGSGYNSEFKSTDADGIITFENVPDGQHTINLRDYPLFSKILNINKLQCIGCKEDIYCEDNEFCNASEYKCEKVEGECGYPSDHKWVNYECCKDSDCSVVKRCSENICKDRTYELVVPDKTNVSENTRIKAYEDGKPCAKCEITIEDPNGNKTKFVTDANGDMTFLAKNRGDHKINLLRGNILVSSKTSTASIDFDSADPLKKIIIILSDEKARNFLVIMVVVIVASLYLYFRRKSGERVKPENPEVQS